MATDLVPVAPAVMLWARESIGVSHEEAARRVGVSVDRLIAWEEGRAEPTLAKLRALGALYQRPLSVFLLPEPPKMFDALRDFRRLPGATDHSWSRALHKVYRRAVEQQQIAIELYEENGESPPKIDIPSFTVEDDPEDIGPAVRMYLGIALDTQFKWRSPEAAFNGWLNAIEERNVYVLRTSEVEPSEMRGFSIPGDVPIIVINALDWPRGQVFTLMHEFAHLMLREGGLCDLLEPETRVARRVETWCNAVAAAALMPRDEFVKETALVLEQSIPSEDEAEEAWTDAILSQLSKRWGVSQEAIARRLVTLNQAPLSFYRAKRDEYQAVWSQERDDEKRARKQKRSKGGPPPHRMVLRDRGRPYVRLVLDSHHRGAISVASVSHLLNLRVKHLDAIEREAW